MLLPDWTLLVKTKSVTEPVRVDEFKKWVRIEGDGQDEIMQLSLAAAKLVVEEITGQTTVNTIYEFKFTCWPEDSVIELPRSPVVSVGSVKYLDAAGAQQTVLSNEYDVDKDHLPPTIRPAYSQSWPSNRTDHASIIVEFTAGYGASGVTVPAPLKAAIMYLASVYYSSRGYEMNDINWQTLRRLVGVYTTKQQVY